MTDQPGHNGFDRRDFLRLLSNGTLLLASGSLLAGCGGGDGGSAGSSTNAQPQTGKVNLTEIGGSSLTVQSVYQINTPVDQSGNFSTQVSNQGAQFLGVTDGGGQLRAIGLSLPGTSSTSLNFSATSTALALVFLASGIVTSDPTVAPTRMSQIQGLASFTPLATYLSANLSTSSLATLTQSGTLSSLTSACVQDWQTHFGVSQAKLRPRVTDGYYFNANFMVGPTNAQPVALSNGAFRYVRVVSRVMGQDGNELTTPTQVLAAMPGAEVPDIASLLTLTVAKPTAETTAINLASTVAASVEIWIKSLGIDSISMAEPASVSAISDSSALFASVLLYLVIPLTDIVLGLGGIFTSNEIFADVADAWDKFGGGIDIASIDTDLQSGDIAKAIIELIKVIVTS